MTRVGCDIDTERRRVGIDRVHQARQQRTLPTTDLDHRRERTQHSDGGRQCIEVDEHPPVAVCSDTFEPRAEQSADAGPDRHRRGRSGSRNIAASLTTSPE